MIRITASLVLAAMLMGNSPVGVAVSGNNQETKYCGSGDFVQQSETINYARKENDEFSIKGDLPNYTVQLGETTCANIAGTILIGYYDRFNENLIPNYKSYTKIGSIIKYKSLGTETTNVLNELTRLMDTNSGGAGTTINGFRSGMSTYAALHSSAYVEEDIGNLNLEKFKTAVKNEKPVAVFLSTFSLLKNTKTRTGGETITVDYHTRAHVVAACGYKIDTYYNENNEIVAQRTYLKVASGLNNYNVTYLCLDGKSIVDKALSVQLT